jgi:hypothetical protein
MSVGEIAINMDGIENVPKISTRRLAINTEFLFAFYKSNLVAL